MKRFFISILVAAGLAAMAAVPPVAPFRKGERVSFFGDSITHHMNYVLDLQLFWALRYPDSPVTLHSCGVPGNRADDGIGRVDWDLKSQRPDRVFVMFGMNDIGRYDLSTSKGKAEGEKNFAAYQKNMRTLVDKLLAQKYQVILMTPTPFDQYAKELKKRQGMTRNDGLTCCAEFVRQLAAEKNLPYVELHAPMTRLLQQHPEAKLCGEDAIHPKGPGHLVMAYYILKAMNVSPVVASTELDAVSGKSTTVNCTVSGVKFTADGGKFCYAPKSLPYELRSKEALKADQLVPFFDDLDREMLTVRNLAPGNYELRTEGTKLAVFSAGELAKGVNLAKLKTPSVMQAQSASVSKWKISVAESAVRRGFGCGGHVAVLGGWNPLDPKSDRSAAIENFAKEKPKHFLLARGKKQLLEYPDKAAELEKQYQTAYQQLYSRAKVKPYLIEIKKAK